MGINQAIVDVSDELLFVNRFKPNPQRWLHAKKPIARDCFGSVYSIDTSIC